MNAQRSFTEILIDPRMGSNRKLEAIEAVIDWAALEPIARAIRSGAHGRPPYAPLAMLKALLLARMYGLSDPALEEALMDRASFRRFCGFSLEQTTPDETTLCRFRIAAAEAGVIDAAFAAVNRQLDARGLILRTGTLVDASIVAARSAKPPVKAGLGAGAGAEPGASWTRKGGKSYFGYKVHAGVDQGSEIIRAVHVTPAHINDGVVADALVSGDEAAVYGDKAYESKTRRAGLRARGIKDRIMHRSHKHQAGLPAWQKRRNQGIARRRAPVERVFASMKQRCKFARMRCYTFTRNLADAVTFAIVHNLKRASTLAAA